MRCPLSRALGGLLCVALLAARASPAIAEDLQPGIAADPTPRWNGLTRFYVTGRLFLGTGGQYMVMNISEPDVISVTSMVFFGIQIGYEFIHRNGFNLGFEWSPHLDFSDVLRSNGDLSLRLGYARESFGVDLALGDYDLFGLSFGPVVRVGRYDRTYLLFRYLWAVGATTPLPLSHCCCPPTPRWTCTSRSPAECG